MAISSSESSSLIVTTVDEHNPLFLAGEMFVSVLKEKKTHKIFTRRRRPVL